VTQALPRHRAYDEAPSREQISRTSTTTRSAPTPTRSSSSRHYWLAFRDLPAIIREHVADGARSTSLRRRRSTRFLRDLGSRSRVDISGHMLERARAVDPAATTAARRGRFDGLEPASFDSCSRVHVRQRATMERKAALFEG